MSGSQQCWAWIGAGAVARRYVHGLAEMTRQGKLTALRVHDLRDDVAQAWCHQLRREGVIARAFDVQTVWHGADACVIATPPQHHLDWLGSALECSLPVLCEKPIVNQPNEMVTLNARLAPGGLVVPSQKYRHAALVKEASAYLRSGALGDVQSLAARFVSYGNLPAGWRTQASGGGVWMDNAPHALDLLQSFWAASLGLDWDEAPACFDPAQDVLEPAIWLSDAQGQSQDALIRWLHDGVACSVEVAWARALKPPASGSATTPPDHIFEAVGSAGVLTLYWQGWQHRVCDGSVVASSHTTYDGAAAFGEVLAAFHAVAQEHQLKKQVWPGWRNYAALAELLLRVHERAT